MIEVKAPNNILATRRKDHLSVFLAGSIEMGTAEDWQKKVTEAVLGMPVVILNPRRDDWDSTWTQSITNPQFYEQVIWELDAMEKADVIFMNFCADTMSPITLLEFGLHAKDGKLMVHCPEGFWRKGNVDIVCEQNGIATYKTLDDMIIALKNHIDYEELYAESCEENGC